MKTGIWPDDTSVLQMGDWLAELRDNVDAEPPAGRHARPGSAAVAQAEPCAATAPAGAILPVEAIPPAEAMARVEARARVHASVQAEAMVRAEAMARAEAMTRAEARARARVTGRAVIGDELKIPIMWCEMGACIFRYSDPAALGEADIRARAIGAGWRVDALGRLACPRCQQSDGQFRTTHPVTLHNPDTTVTATAAALSKDAAATGGRAEARVIPETRQALVSLPAQERTGSLSNHCGHARAAASAIDSSALARTRSPRPAPAMGQEGKPWQGSRRLSEAMTGLSRGRHRRHPRMVTQAAGG